MRAMFILLVFTEHFNSCDVYSWVSGWVILLFYKSQMSYGSEGLISTAQVSLSVPVPAVQSTFKVYAHLP